LEGELKKAKIMEDGLINEFEYRSIESYVIRVVERKKHLHNEKKKKESIEILMKDTKDIQDEW